MKKRESVKKGFVLFKYTYKCQKVYIKYCLKSCLFREIINVVTIWKTFAIEGPSFLWFEKVQLKLVDEEKLYLAKSQISKVSMR